MSSVCILFHFFFFYHTFAHEYYGRFFFFPCPCGRHSNSWAGYRNALEMNRKREREREEHRLAPFKRNDGGGGRCERTYERDGHKKKKKRRLEKKTRGEAMNNRATNPVKCGLWEIQLPIQRGRRHW
jgi:hypothetical protein